MQLLLTLAIFFLSVVVHEYAHGWVAWKLGDYTAKNSGRLTLNPLAHIDPIGTVLLPLILLATRSPFIFGWAKPVPVDFYSLKNPKRDMTWVGLAGPTANILFAVLFSIILKAGIFLNSLALSDLVISAIVINLVLAVFNALPIPPLDGSRVAMGLLPRGLSMQYAKLEPYGFFIIFGLLYLGVVGNVIWPIVVYLARLLGINI